MVQRMSVGLLVLTSAVPALGHPIPSTVLEFAAQAASNRYEQVNLVSNRAEDRPQILDPLLLDAWGIAIRPPGAGGHWWVMNARSGTTTTYVGDAPGVPLYQDELKVVHIPRGRIYERLTEYVSQPTGVVYTGRTSTEFMVSGEGITGASKFVFCALDGTLSAWTTDQTTAVNMVDLSADGAMFTGLAVTEQATGNRLFVCDFGLERFRIFDGSFNELPVPAGRFRDPRVPATFSHYNCQVLDGLLYICFAYVGDDPGEEDVYPGYGFVSAFDLDGNLVRQFEHRMELNAPWGVAIAPEDFGALSGMLLVGNFGDGRILAYNRSTGRYVDYLRDVAGRPAEIDGLWGLQFGNGVSLGYTNHLYFAAGPNQEEDGLFGKFVPYVVPATVIEPD
jgi:uncharacterized protein (TIGR03118 family)